MAAIVRPEDEEDEEDDLGGVAVGAAVGVGPAVGALVAENVSKSVEISRVEMPAKSTPASAAAVCRAAVNDVVVTALMVLVTVFTSAVDATATRYETVTSVLSSRRRRFVVSKLTLV